MPEGLGDILRRVALTGLLAGSLGLALYAGAAAASGHPATPFILALLLAAPLAGLCFWLVLEGWRTGMFAVWRRSVHRDEQPVSYWFNMAWYGLCGFALVAIVVWSGWRLARGLPAV